MITLRIYVKPNAKRSQLLKHENGVLHVSLKAKPQEGEANIELISFLSSLFHVPKSHIILLRGLTSRYKQVSLPLNDVLREFLQQGK